MAEGALVRMSLQGNYLEQIVPGGSGRVKLPDVFTVWAAANMVTPAMSQPWREKKDQNEGLPSGRAFVYCLPPFWAPCRRRAVEVNMWLAAATGTLYYGS
jgi:hypothetical protein